MKAQMKAQSKVTAKASAPKKAPVQKISKRRNTTKTISSDQHIRKSAEKHLNLQPGEAFTVVPDGQAADLYGSLTRETTFATPVTRPRTSLRTQSIPTRPRASVSYDKDGNAIADFNPGTYRSALKRGKSLAAVQQAGEEYKANVKPQAHTNHYGEDKFYNPDEDSDFEPHYAAPPDGVHAFPFADKAFKFSIRFGQDPSKVHHLNIYEGETYWDAVHRQQLHFPDAKCLPKSTYLQEEQFFDGANGCFGCVAQFPIGYKAKLPPISDTELSSYQAFWEYRVHQEKTYRDGGKSDSIRFLCTLNFEPSMDGVEIYAPGTHHPHYDDVDFIRSNDSAMV